MRAKCTRTCSAYSIHIVNQELLLSVPLCVRPSVRLFLDVIHVLYICSTYTTFRLGMSPGKTTQVRYIRYIPELKVRKINCGEVLTQNENIEE